MAALSYPNVYVGDSFDIEYTVTQDGSAKDLTSATVEYKWMSGGSAAFTLTIGSGVTVTNAAGGLLTVRLSTENTTQTPRKYKVFLTITDSDGLVSTCDDDAVNLIGKTG